MARMGGANVEKLQGGLGNQATGTDNHFALIVDGLPDGDVKTAINNDGKGIVITSVYAAEEIGINASFDANNDITLYFDITEYFRLAPEATLYLYDNQTGDEVRSFLNLNKEIKGYGFHLAFDAAGTNLVSTINAHQAMVNSLAEVNRLIDFVLIGADGLSTFTQNLTALSAPNVSVTIACHDTNRITAVGAALGMLAVRQINENMGSVNIERKPRAKAGTPDYPLTDVVLNRWIEAFTSKGDNVDSLNGSALNDLLEKGFILAAGYEGYAGFFFTNSNTCITTTSDFAYIENNRTWNKAARIIRATLLPKVKGKFKKNPSTGFIAASTVASWNSSLNKELEKMVARDEISGYDVYVQPNQIVNNTTPCVVSAMIVTDGIVHEFNVKLGLTNSI